MRRAWVLGLVAVALVAMPGCSGFKPRNPFGLKDVRDPTGADVATFAGSVQLTGDDADRNAEPWVQEVTAGKAGSLEGDWLARWDVGSGRAQIKVDKDRVFILYSDANGRWLLEAVRAGNKLAGRWENTANPSDTGPFAGLVVNDERIDGYWATNARWDFRRKLTK